MRREKAVRTSGWKIAGIMITAALILATGILMPVQKPRKPLQLTATVSLSGISLRDSSAQAVSEAKLSRAKIGDIIMFGKYEQDNNYDNGKEPIEWKVLKKTDRKMLLITDKIIESRPFNYTYKKLRWRNSDLRAWLNGAFLDSSFSSEERSLILKTTVTDAGNKRYGIGPGAECCDYIYLLSIEQAFSYFRSDADRRAQATEYVLDQGILSNSNGEGWWWLRSPGQDLDHAAAVCKGGSVFKEGDSVSRYNFGVRPVMWVKIDPEY